MNGVFLAAILHATAALTASQAEASHKSPPSRVSGMVNLNNATPEQLKLLPGVKDNTVANIIAHRAKQPFARPEELVNVKGFSRKRYEKLRPFLAVNGASTIRVAEKIARKVARAGAKKLRKR
jgi:competence protein ComEA